MSPQIWFITGASSGFGRVATEHVLAQGDIAVATLRKPEELDDLKAKYGADKLLVLKLDVTKTNEISQAFQKAIDVFGRIDVVFNNAGFGVFAEVEGSTDEAVRSLFDTNFFGAMNVSREAVRVFRDVNKPIGGRLLITSSVAGLSPVPIIGYYAGTKHALEGTTTTMVRELDPDWNIKASQPHLFAFRDRWLTLPRIQVTLIEAGSFETSGFGKATVCPPHPAYTKPTLPTVIGRNIFADPNGPKLPFNDLQKGVAKIYKLTTLDNPPLHFPLGKDTFPAVRKQIAALTKALEEYESWSEDL
ncbi:hypothetical protein EIP86_006951 [Pleurotus ostreatoroseus]|nr:hypothetical protein EIP86_006951 [Pleurotus ostreatoroseus]